MASLKMTHIALVLLTLVGLVYVWHMYTTHGTFNSFKSGLGITR